MSPRLTQFRSIGGKPLERFACWADVLTYVRNGGLLYYHAPLDIRPQTVAVPRIYKNGKLRIDAGCGCDPFTADEGHLSRMMRPYTGPLDPSGNPSQPGPSGVSYTHPADAIAHQDD